MRRHCQPALRRPIALRCSRGRGHTAMAPANLARRPSVRRALCPAATRPSTSALLCRRRRSTATSRSVRVGPSEFGRPPRCRGIIAWVSQVACLRSMHAIQGTCCWILLCIGSSCAHSSACGGVRSTSTRASAFDRSGVGERQAHGPIGHDAIFHTGGAVGGCAGAR